MTDDIVTRLRGKEHGNNDLRCKACDSFCCHCELCDCCLEIMEVSLEAADEIEQLREWKDLAYEMRNKYWWFMRRRTLEKFDFLHKTDWKRHKPLENTRHE